MKTFLITGASSGIGAEVARQAVAAGYRVALAARSRDKLDSLVEELGGPQRAIAISCDVSDLADQEAMVAETLEAFGSIDVAFANAGLGTTAPGTEHGDPENWREMILTNIYGCILTARVCLPHVRAAKGWIVLTGSRAGRVTLKGSVYGATKWAVTGYGQNLREELAGTGTRVMLLEPGMVDTPFFDTPKPQALTAGDVARALIFAVTQPPHVDIPELLIVPTPPVE